MQSARHAIGKHVVPYATCSIGSVAREEARAHLRCQRFVTLRTRTARSCQPGIKATPRDPERPAQPSRRPNPPVLRDEADLHIDSFAKYAAAFFRMSRSALSFVTSRFSRAISAC